MKRTISKLLAVCIALVLCVGMPAAADEAIEVEEIPVESLSEEYDVSEDMAGLTDVEAVAAESNLPEIGDVDDAVDETTQGTEEEPYYEETLPDEEEAIIDDSLSADDTAEQTETAQTPADDSDIAPAEPYEDMISDNTGLDSGMIADENIQATEDSERGQENAAIEEAGMDTGDEPESGTEEELIVEGFDEEVLEEDIADNMVVIDNPAQDDSEADIEEVVDEIVETEIQESLDTEEPAMNSIDEEMSGKFGNLYWELTGEEDALVLTITGQGRMEETDSYPWKPFFEEIVKIIIGEGITSIADGAFSVFYNVTEVTIPASVTEISSSAFEFCDSLRDVYFGGTTPQWKKLISGHEEWYDEEEEDDGLLNANIHCNDIHVSQIKLDKHTVTIAVGKPYTLHATIAPDNATEQGIIWESSDERVVTVDSEGVVTAVKGGEAVITATTKDGNFTDTCKITVKAPPATKIVSLKSTSTSKVTIKWAQIDSVSGYQVQYSQNEDFSEAKTFTIKNNTTTAKAISKLSEDTQYYFHVRTYKKESNHTYYSVWSKTKSVVTKSPVKRTIKDAATIKLWGGEKETFTFTAYSKKIYVVDIRISEFIADDDAKVRITLKNEEGEILQNDVIKLKEYRGEDYVSWYYDDALILPKGTYTYTIKNLSTDEYKITYSIIGYTKISSKAKFSKTIKVPSGKYVLIGQLGEGCPLIKSIRCSNKCVHQGYIVDNNTGNVYVWADKKGSTTITIELRNGKKYKIKAKVTAGAPDFYAHISRYNTRDNYFVVSVTNNRASDLIINRTDAEVIDDDYKRYDRKIRQGSSVTVKPGKTKEIYFYVSGDTTWPNYKDFTLHSTFTYEGKTYKWKVDHSESYFEADGKWYGTFWVR